MDIDGMVHDTVPLLQLLARRRGMSWRDDARPAEIVNKSPGSRGLFVMDRRVAEV